MGLIEDLEVPFLTLFHIYDLAVDSASCGISDAVWLLRQAVAERLMIIMLLFLCDYVWRACC